jgi:hypothetical protein
MITLESEIKLVSHEHCWSPNEFLWGIASQFLLSDMQPSKLCYTEENEESRSDKIDHLSPFLLVKLTVTVVGMAVCEFTIVVIS